VKSCFSVSISGHLIM